MHVWPLHQQPPLPPEHYERRHVSIRWGHAITSQVSNQIYRNHPVMRVCRDHSFPRVCRKHPFPRVVIVSHQFQRVSDKTRRYVRRRGRKQGVQNNEMHASNESRDQQSSQQGWTQDSTRRRMHQWNTINQVGPGHIPVHPSSRQWTMSLPHPMILFQDYLAPG